MIDMSRWYSSLVRLFQRLAARFRPQGASPARPYTYALASWMFIRLLGLVYVIAFGSLWLQLDGLIGREGIVPAAPLLAAAQKSLGIERWWQALVDKAPGLANLKRWGAALAGRPTIQRAIAACG